MGPAEVPRSPSWGMPALWSEEGLSEWPLAGGA